jgi:hypothetical protein
VVVEAAESSAKAALPEGDAPAELKAGSLSDAARYPKLAPRANTRAICHRELRSMAIPSVEETMTIQFSTFDSKPTRAPLSALIAHRKPTCDMPVSGLLPCLALGR